MIDQSEDKACIRAMRRLTAKPWPKLALCKHGLRNPARAQIKPTLYLLVPNAGAYSNVQTILACVAASAFGPSAKCKAQPCEVVT